MTDRPKTPEEVIKALTICPDNRIYSCDGCPYHDSESYECDGNVMLDALALLKAAYGKHGLIQQLQDALAQCQEDNNS